MQNLATCIGVDPPDVVTLLDFYRIVLMSVDDATVQDEHKAVRAGLLSDGFDHGLILFGFSNEFNNFDKLSTLLEFVFLTIDGRFHLRLL